MCLYMYLYVCVEFEWLERENAAGKRGNERDGMTREVRDGTRAHLSPGVNVCDLCVSVRLTE